MPLTDTYVLRVVGDSMKAEGMHEGDFIIIERRTTPAPGEMVVALVQNAAGEAEATIKRFYREGDIIRLQPLNQDLPPIFVPDNKVSIAGVAVGMMRKF